MRRIFQTAKLPPAPILICDEPEDGSEVGRGTVVSGWAYSSAGIRGVSVWLDGQRVGRAELGLEREDVAQAHPGWSEALRSGFRHRLEAAPATAAERAELMVVAEDDEGRRAEVRRVVGVNESLFDPILVCDEPEEGSEVSLGTVVSGWAYSPSGIREVSVWLDGQRVGLADLGLEREDVAEAQPDWPEALRSGFRYRLEAVPTMASVESVELTIVAEDEQGRRAEVRRVVLRDPEGPLKEKIESKRQKLRRLNDEILAAKDRAEIAEHVKRAKKEKLELLKLMSELRIAQGRAEDEPVMGALPDFAVIGAAKSGTTYFYHLLTHHPLVEPAAFKEPHFFDTAFDLGVEWYRQCFPAPRWKDGRRTITGEASPGYLFHPHAAKRMAGMVPQARLIALLRNPVDRTYSAYHHRVRKGQETRTFKETVGVAFDESNEKYLSRSIYVDHLQRWSEFFPREQMLVLRSEDFFENPKETLKRTFDFLDLPEWEPEASELGDKRNTGGYEEKMDPATRRRLEEYFEPHNRRLYDYLGVDFGW